MSSTKSNIKTIARSTVSIPAELGATAVQLTADATSLLSGVIRGAVPAAVAGGHMVGKFMAGMAMSDAKPEDVAAIYNNTTLADVMSMIDAGAVKAGQAVANSLNDDEDNVDLTKLSKAKLIEMLKNK
jgi:uncharacterized cupredoxin-like copper-binding protein